MHALKLVFFRELWQKRGGKKVRQCHTFFRDALNGLCRSMSSLNHIT